MVETILLFLDRPKEDTSMDLIQSSKKLSSTGLLKNLVRNMPKRFKIDTSTLHGSLTIKVKIAPDPWSMHTKPQNPKTPLISKKVPTKIKNIEIYRKFEI